MATRQLRVLMLVGLVGVAAGCDKAAPAYKKGQTAEQQKDYTNALTWYEAAVRFDPDSKAGKSAAQKMVELRPLADREFAEWQEKKAEQKRQAALAGNACADGCQGIWFRCTAATIRNSDFNGKDCLQSKLACLARCGSR